MNVPFQENVNSSAQNITHFSDCPQCEQEHCVFGFSTTSKITFTLLSVTCGIFAIGGNLALLGALNRTATLRSPVNYSFIVSLALADFMVGLTMTPLYVCYAVAYEHFWPIKLEGFLWIVTVTATTYSLSAVSLDRFISVIYPLQYHQVMTERLCHVIIFLIWIGSVILHFQDWFLMILKNWKSYGSLVLWPQ